MSTTIVFACKSNSCRSQMAEAWAHEWIKAERLDLERKRKKCIGAVDGDEGGIIRDVDGQKQRRLISFLDGLMVVSVALDEKSISNNQKGLMVNDSSRPPSSTDKKPTASLTTNFETSRQPCVTCDGETCTTSSPPTKRRKPKEKAIQAMAQDGVDISSYYAKSFKEILPFVLRHNEMLHRSVGSDSFSYKQQLIDFGVKSWRMHLSFARLRSALEYMSREIGMAYAGVHRDVSYRSIHGIDNPAGETSSSNETTLNTDNNAQLVDNLIILCSCQNSLKRQLSDMSKKTFDWDIDPPTAAAQSEGDGAYLRVSRQIRDKVEDFMNQLKECALNVDKDEDGINVSDDGWNADLRMVETERLGGDCST